MGSTGAGARDGHRHVVHRGGVGQVRAAEHLGSRTHAAGERQHQQRRDGQKVRERIIHKVAVSAHAAHHIGHALAGHGAALCPLGAQHGAQVVQPLAKLAPGGRKVFPHGAQKARRKAAQCAHHQQHAIKHPQHGALAGARKAQQRIFCFKADIIQNFAHTRAPRARAKKLSLGTWPSFPALAPSPPPPFLPRAVRGRCRHGLVR